MKEVTVQEFGCLAAELIHAVAEGEYVTIFNDGVPIAQLVPVLRPQVVRKFGALNGKVSMADDFDAQLPDDIQAAFDGKS